MSDAEKVAAGINLGLDVASRLAPILVEALSGALDVEAARRRAYEQVDAMLVDAAGLRARLIADDDRVIADGG